MICKIVWIDVVYNNPSIFYKQNIFLTSFVKSLDEVISSCFPSSEGLGPGLVYLRPLFQETGFNKPIPCFLWWEDDAVGDILYLFKITFINHISFKVICVIFSAIKSVV